MRYQNLLAIFIIALLINSCGQKNSSTLLLFEKQGKDWYEGGEAQWSFNDGVLVGTASSNSGFVITEKSYKDFELTLEFQPDSTINSGIFVRCNVKELSNIDCYEMNIWDLHPDQKWRTGSVVSREVPKAYVETLDKWNTYKIRCKGSRIQTWVNDQLTVDIDNKDLVEGYIALQAAETGTVKFRNIQLQMLNEN
ncbi:DUF1080 domain-containing protein [Muriicola sp. Z0-33]|uniref:3-keto-disaccharide hydrolase n=1 Tax=Muriicola sp. Z0-33 TaxID=2816957 RepID=UPI002238B625|nr:DUF1080 domain-containing protein [Muriicola sp. Z0-33]MCW5515942.1 DUF1080 domain-containing protein [Muriicola sp. Z0-33]